MNIKFLISLSIIIVLLVALVMMFNHINGLQNKIRIGESNISALNDTLKTYKTKNGTIVAEKEAYYSNLKELENVNKQLYDSIKYYEKELKIKIGSAQIVGVTGKIITVYDTIKVQKEKISDTITKFIINADNNDSIISSNITAELKLYSTCDSISLIDYLLNSTFNIDNLKLNILTGYRKKGFLKPSVQYVSSITTNDERFKISSVESWINNEFEKKRYLSLKPGLFLGGFYDPFYKHFSLGIGLGLTVQYIK
ncbi:MAG: hypothetical protein M0Q13_14955 [Methanothrix sp.]|jgi:hypothetical protein|nr:hypothetical protein [Methanothrix sp.]